MAQIMIQDDTDSNKCNEGNKWPMKDFHTEICQSQVVKIHTNLLVHFSIKLICEQGFVMNLKTEV